MNRNPEDIESDIRRTVQRHFGPPPRQASDAFALVALALFIGTCAILLQLFVEN